MIKKIRMNDKAFSLVEILIAITLLVVISVAVGTVLIGTQNSSLKVLMGNKSQKELSEVQRTMHDSIIGANAGLRYWVLSNGEAKLVFEDETADQPVDKMLVLYSDNGAGRLSISYYKYDYSEKIIQFASSSETLTDENDIYTFGVESDSVFDKLLSWKTICSDVKMFSADLTKFNKNKIVTVSIDMDNPDDNYSSNDSFKIRNDIFVNSEITMRKRDMTIITRPYIKDSDTVVQYNGQPHKPLIYGYDSNTMTMSGDYEAKTNVGKYKVYVSLRNPSDNQWGAAPGEDTPAWELELEWEISPAELSVSWAPGDRFVYDGTDHALSCSITSGLINGDTCGITLSQTSVKDAGQYDITATLDNTNYAIKRDASYSVTVEKASSFYTTEPSARSGLVYNGSPQALVTGGSSSCGDVYYSYAVDNGQNVFSTPSTSIPQVAEAGDYIVRYQIVCPSSGNYFNSPEKEIAVRIQRNV